MSNPVWPYRQRKIKSFTNQLIADQYKEAYQQFKDQGLDKPGVAPVQSGLRGFMIEQKLLEDSWNNILKQCSVVD